jgi:hypothetical protein
MINKKVFKTKDDNGQEIELAVLRPSPKVQVAAQLEFNRAWAQAEKAGSILRRNLDELATRSGLWSDELAKKVTDLETEIVALERKLRGGANSFSTVDEAKACALKIRSLRAERLGILRDRNSLDAITAEAFADSARLQYLVSQCTVYNEGNKAGQPYFTSLDNYLSLSEGELALAAFNAYLELLYSPSGETSDEVYENTWLKKYKFMDDKGRLIDSKGRYVSEDGKLIDSDYNYILPDGRLCDKDGNLVDKNGNYIIEYKEFGGGVEQSNTPPVLPLAEVLPAISPEIGVSTNSENEE